MKKIITLSIVTATFLVFSGCSGNDKKEEAKTEAPAAAVEKKAEATNEAATKVENKAQESATAAKEAANKAAQATKEAAAKAAEATKEAATATVQKAKETANKAVEATKEAATKAAEATKEATDKAIDSTKEAAAAVAQKAKEAVSGGAANEKGAQLYTACKGCHGPKGNLKALNKSAIIAGQSAADLEKKLMEYKAGTRNVAGMGTLMQGQVSKLSDEDIKALAEYIANLK